MRRDEDCGRLFWASGDGDVREGDVGDEYVRLRLREEGEGVFVMSFGEGGVDGHGVREMYETCVRLLGEDCRKLLVDFSGLEHVSSGAMGMLVMIRRKCLSVGAQLHVVVDESSVMESFELMKLPAIFGVFGDVKGALDGFK